MNWTFYKDIFFKKQYEASGLMQKRWIFWWNINGWRKSVLKQYLGFIFLRGQSGYNKSKQSWNPLPVLMIANPIFSSPITGRESPGLMPNFSWIRHLFPLCIYSWTICLVALIVYGKSFLSVKKVLCWICTKIYNNWTINILFIQIIK